jgi:microcystin-dependent protein
MKNFDNGCWQAAILFDYAASAKRVSGFPQIIRCIALSLATVLIGSAAWAQAPDRISYQAVVRDGNNDLIVNTQIGVRVTILQGSPAGANVYRERHAPTTNAAGLVALQIGAGSALNGSVAAINWGAGPYFVEQAIDLAGGTNYSLTSTTELLSVPYALYAKTVDRATQVAVADTADAVSDAGQLGGLSIGTVLLFAGEATAVPTGWLLCDGAAYNTSTYPALFNLIGATYGAAPGQFRVPDLRGRGPMGRDAGQTEFAALGQTGGSKTHTLSLNELPAHDHQGAQSAGNHRHNVGTRNFFTSMALAGVNTNPGGDGSDTDLRFTFSAGDHTHTISSEGGGAAHNNLQPYLTMNFIIKAN